MAVELNEDKVSGDITVVSGEHKKTYHGLTGSKEGVYRTLITINDLPALQVSGRDDFYYTLTVDGARLYIDCAYADARNSSNGARVSAGVCGLRIEPGAEYEDVAQDFSNKWQETIFSFDTQDISSDGYSRDYLLGEIGGVKIYDRYSSLSDLENAMPKKIIRGPSGCYDFQNKVGFMVFLNGPGKKPMYLDLIDFKGPIQVQRMQGEDLRRLAAEDCN
ncbi:MULTISPECIES: hypothetical protein [Pseudomonas]|jgi:hypothetical protein|uniref:hypothetical protein n=1 Tax=Pseudomonas TaxID=286 RepID=UPI0011B05B41|nr:MULTISPECIES: hypothetical protein [Pseudomonas]QXN52586.1 hypothetical protein KW062_12970 [Pseudomonas fluorescens]WSO26924.1 hypothetical protein VUJ50_13040 [Pseudomonas fluorescens]